mgnify:CR=1 FL=1
MGKRKEKKKKNQRKSGLDLLLIFWFSLLVVLLAGGALLFAYPQARARLSAFFTGEAVEKGAEDGKNGNEAANVSAGGGAGQGLGEKLPSRAEAEESAADDTSAETEDTPADTSKYGAVLADAAYMEENGIYALPAAREESVTLRFAGDILFDDEYAVMATIKQNGGDVTGRFSPELLALMRDADLFMLNNEFPYTKRGEPTPEKTFTFRADPETAAFLPEIGVDVVSLANNHAYDFGEISLLDSLDTLRELGMPYVGAGRNIEEAAKPAYFIIGDIKIGILAATQIERLDPPDTRGATEKLAGVFRCWDPKRLLAAIEETKKNCDFCIVFIHWGTENTDELDWAQLDQVKKLADAGADAIIGAHPHVLQRLDVVNGVPVAYSLGNFLFNSRTLDTGILELVLRRNPAGTAKESSLAVTYQGTSETADGQASDTPYVTLSSVRFIPVLQSDCRAALLSGAEKERVLSYMRELSEGVYIDGEGYLQLTP